MCLPVNLVPIYDASYSAFESEDKMNPSSERSLRANQPSLIEYTVGCKNLEPKYYQHIGPELTFHIRKLGVLGPASFIDSSFPNVHST
jgi:hypothetical protein